MSNKEDVAKRYALKKLKSIRADLWELRNSAYISQEVTFYLDEVYKITESTEKQIKYELVN